MTMWAECGSIGNESRLAGNLNGMSEQEIIPPALFIIGPQPRLIG